MFEVESFGHGSEDGDVGWGAAVLGIVFFADGGEVDDVVVVVVVVVVDI